MLQFLLSPLAFLYVIDVYLTMNFTIVETAIFTRKVTELLSDEDYKSFQAELLLHPEKGDLIKGGKGLRKIRVSSSGRGKRGGSRVIYYLQSEDKIILLLLIYPKNEQENLTTDQLNRFVTLIEGLKK